MASRRDFLHHGMRLSALGALAPTLILPAGVAQAAPQAAPADLTPPPDLFDAQLLDLDFWVRKAASAPRSCTGKTAR
jgi:hypothetical protein